MELSDLIRMNRLVRNRIDFDGFRSWYDTLPSEGQRELTSLLWTFAHEAGVDESRFEEAVVRAEVPSDHPVVDQARAFGKDDLAALVGLDRWVEGLPDAERSIAFKLFVFLFGIAEGQVYRNEAKECCNHWWHRDLLDDRVVQDLLTDRRYYMTSMKDDDRIKREVRVL
jgi:hypothetical protein